MSLHLPLIGTAIEPEDELAQLGPVPVPDGAPRPATEPRGVVWACAAALLGYPQESLFEALPAIGSALRGVRGEVGAAAVDPLLVLAGRLGGTSLLAAQQHYVATFDTKRKCCPYLTYYLHGDTRRRGMALWRVKAALAACGLEPASGELPDHLPLICELAAVGDERVALTLLTEHRPGLTLLHAALSQAGSPYADAPAAIEALLPAHAPGHHDRAGRLAQAGPPSEAVGLPGWTTPFPPSSDSDDRGARR